MRSSEPLDPRARGEPLRAALRASASLLLASLLALLPSACARVSARPPVPQTPASTSAPADERAFDAEPRADAPGRLDPSEEITPEELATIPDPVAGRESRVLPAAASAVWRVQIFASSSRTEAERVAVAASAALGVPYVLDDVSGLVKVRLGRFATEAEAESLRERAIEAGYHGAFRVQDSGATSVDSINE